MFFPVQVGTCTTNSTLTTAISSQPTIAVRGSYLYICSSTGNTISCYDISWGTTPTLKETFTCETNAAPQFPQVFDGNYMVVAYANTNKLAIFDISDPSAISLLSATSLSGGLPSGYAAHPQVIGTTCFVGGVGYAANGSPNYNVCKLDISNKASPSLSGTKWWISGGASSSTLRDMAVYNGKLYASGFRYASPVSGQCYVAEINPSTMATTNYCVFGSVGSGLDGSGLAFSPSGGHVFNVVQVDAIVYSINTSTWSVVDSATIFPAFAGSSSPACYRPRDKKYYVGKGNGTSCAVYSIDVSDPTNLGTYAEAFSTSGEGVSDLYFNEDDPCNTVYVATWSGGAKVYLKADLGG